MGQKIIEIPDEGFECPRYVKALLREILRVIERVWWNNKQTTFEWSYSGYEWITANFQVRTYYWGDDAAVAALPNLAFDGVELRWYKYPLRSLELNNVTKESAEWVAWFANFIRVIEGLEEED